MLGGIGGFAGAVRLPLHRYREPVLASSTDGVGTKSPIAQAMDMHDTIGIDLVAMVVDDLVACGAEPLFLQDYIAVGKLVPEQIATIVSGIAEGCRQAGCALLGGETAEHPGLMAHGRLRPVGHRRSGSSTRTTILRPERVRPGDVLVGDGGRPACTPTATRWPGTCCSTSPGCRCDGHVEEFGRTLGEELLEPTRIYALDCLAVAARDRRAHLRAHHRRRAGAATWRGCIPAGLTAPWIDRALDPAAGVRPNRRARPGRARRDGEDVQHGHRHGRGAARRTTSTARWRC